MEQSPTTVIRKFLGLYESAEEVENILSEMLQTALSSKRADEWDGEQRADAAFFTDRIKELIRAVFKLEFDS